MKGLLLELWYFGASVTGIFLALQIAGPDCWYPTAAILLVATAFLLDAYAWHAASDALGQPLLPEELDPTKNCSLVLCDGLGAISAVAAIGLAANERVRFLGLLFGTTSYCLAALLYWIPRAGTQGEHRFVLRVWGVLLEKKRDRRRWHFFGWFAFWFAFAIGWLLLLLFPSVPAPNWLRNWLVQKQWPTFTVLAGIYTGASLLGRGRRKTNPQQFAVLLFLLAVLLAVVIAFHRP